MILLKITAIKTWKMLQDAELTNLEAQLRAARFSSQKEYETLQQALLDYTTLVNEYRRLKSDYEEERESREKYRKLAKGQERNPFVLVLVDGDITSSMMICFKLTQKVATGLRNYYPGQCRTIYTNLDSTLINAASWCGYTPIYMHSLSHSAGSDLLVKE